MTRKNTDTESRWTRLATAIPTRTQAVTIFLAVLMIASMPIPFAAGFDSGTAAASTTSSLSTASLSATTTAGDNASYYDDFEDEDYDGWVSSSDDLSISSDSLYGNQSLRVDDAGDGGTWADGPTFNTQESFELSGTYYPNSGDGTASVRFGIIEQDHTEGDPILAQVKHYYGENDLSDEVRLGSSNPGQDEISLSEESITDPALVKNSWVDFRLQFSNGKMRLKLWEAGTSEPSDWQLTNEAPDIEGQFRAFPGQSEHNQEILFDQVDAGGHVISGQFVDQNGNPVPNATVEGYGVNYANIEERLKEQAENLNVTARELDQEAQKLLDEAEGTELPDGWQTFQGEYSTTGGTISSSEFTSGLDGTYPLVHSRNEWGSGSGPILHTQERVGNPRTTIGDGQQVIISLWDLQQANAILPEGPISNSHPGQITDGTIVLEQYSAGSAVDRETIDATEDAFTIKRSWPAGDIEVPAIKKHLATGIYRVHPEGSPEKSYWFQVGDAQAQWNALETELKQEALDSREEADQLTDRAQDLVNSINVGDMERRTTTTDENGTFSIRFQRGVQKAAVQGYRADGEILTDITSPSVDDLRTAAEDGYNGTYVLGVPKRFDVPTQDVTLEGYRADELPQHPLEDFNDFLEWKQGQILDEKVSDIQSEYDERIGQLERELLVRDYESNRGLVETVPGAETRYLNNSDFAAIQNSEELNTTELQTESSLMRQALLTVDTSAEDLVAIFESHASVVRSIPGAEEEYLSESSYDEIPAAADLSDSELETELELMQSSLGNIDSHANDRLTNLYQNHRALIETVPGAEEAYLESSSFDSAQNAGDLSSTELGRETELMATALGSMKEVKPPETGDSPIIIEDGELNAEYGPIPGGIDTETLQPELHWSDGTSEDIPDEYWSVESTGTLGWSSQLVIEGFPIGEVDPAAFDIRVIGGGEGGVLDDRITGTNPNFRGIIPDVRAIDVSTLSPGANERVSLELRTGDSGGFDSLEDVEVFGPNGNALETSVDASGSASFDTNGAGRHVVRATYTSGSGDRFVRTFGLKALEEGRDNYATVRAEKATGDGLFAIAGDGLRDAEIGVDGDRVFISAIAHSDETPSRVDVKAGAAMTPQIANLDIRVLEGSDEATVDSKVETVVHFDSLADDAILWRGEPQWFGGQPLSIGENERYGEVIERENGKVVIRTYTEADGSLSLYVNEDPDWAEAQKHRVSSVTSWSLPYWVPGMAVPVIGLGLVRRRKTA